MRIISTLIVAAALTSSAFAAETKVMTTTNPNAVQIQGNTTIDAKSENQAAIAIGEKNVAKNTSGAIKGGTQIQGNTTIKSKQKNAVAVAVGKDNKATNETGVIGGK